MQILEANITDFVQVALKINSTHCSRHSAENTVLLCARSTSSNRPDRRIATKIPATNDSNCRDFVKVSIKAFTCCFAFSSADLWGYGAANLKNLQIILKELKDLPTI